MSHCYCLIIHSHARDSYQMDRSCDSDSIVKSHIRRIIISKHELSGRLHVLRPEIKINGINRIKDERFNFLSQIDISDASVAIRKKICISDRFVTDFVLFVVITERILRHVIQMLRITWKACRMKNNLTWRIRVAIIIIIIIIIIIMNYL